MFLKKHLLSFFAALGFPMLVLAQEADPSELAEFYFVNKSKYILYISQYVRDPNISGAIEEQQLYVEPGQTFIYPARGPLPTEGSLIIDLTELKVYEPSKPPGNNQKPFFTSKGLHEKCKSAELHLPTPGPIKAFYTTIDFYQDQNYNNIILCDVGSPTVEIISK